MPPIKGHRIVFPSLGTAAIEDYELAEPGPYEILVETRQSLVSAGTEMTNLVNAFERGPQHFPAYPGYSNVGIVAAAGANVGEQYPVGTAVLTMGKHWSHFLRDLSPTRERGPEYVQALEPGTDLRRATFAILGSVSFHGIRRAEPQIGNSVAVFGQGVVGQLIVQLARAAGCRPVIAVDLVASRLEKAKLSGAHHTLDASKVDPAKAIMDLTGGVGAELVFDATRTPNTLPPMMKCAAHGAKLLIVGSAGGRVEIDTFTELQLRELSIIGVFQPAAPTTPHSYNRWTQQRNRLDFLNLIADGAVKVDHLITHTPSWREGVEIFSMIHEGPGNWIGVVFDWK